MQVTFDHFELVAPDIKTLWFKPDKPVRYIAGQFTELYLPHGGADDRGERRWFTLSSSPQEPLLGITTKFSPEDGSTFKQRLAALQPGTALHLAEPMGDFVLPKDPTVPLIFVAGGMGITPMHSMVKWLHGTGERRQLHLIYAARHPDELAFQSLFTAYDCRLTPIVTQPTADYQGEIGSLNTDRILQLAGDDETALIYLSGPEAMVETFYKELKIKGVDKRRLVTDYFPGYQQF